VFALQKQQERQLLFAMSHAQNPSKVVEPGREIPVFQETDVLVCGGGPAGIGAALAAANAGARVTLLEVNGCLGGIWTAGLLTYVLDPKNDSPVTMVILEEMKTLGSAVTGTARKFLWAEHSFVFSPEPMKLALERLCRRAGIHIQLHTRVCAALLDDSANTISAVLTESKSGRQAWKAKVYIDATGDGDLAAQAGCDYAFGRPGTQESQPMSLLCLLATPQPDGLTPFCMGGGASFIQELATRGIKTSYGSPLLLPVRDGIFAIMMNHHYGSGLDAADITQATMDARAEIYEMVAKLAAQGGVWEGLQLVATAEQIGVREGRRIKGLYTVTADDVHEGKRHEDGICRVSFPIDVHSTSKKTGLAFDHENKLVSQPFDIPLRALISADRENLLMAGRCISGDFLAHSSYRVTGDAVVTGEAAGALAARAIASARSPRACCGA